MPSRPKKKLPAHAKKGKPGSVPKGRTARISSPASSAIADWGPRSWVHVLFGASAFFWLAFKIAGHPQAERAFLVIALLIGSSYLLNLKRLGQLLALLGTGWALAAVALGANPNFAYAFSLFQNFFIPNPVTLLALGMGLLLAFWRFLPPPEPSRDISRLGAWCWFVVIFAVAAWMRFYKVHEAAGIYWDDCAVGITDPRGILEFHERPLLMPIANREPFYPYFMAGLWSFMPNAYAIFVHRLGSALIDLGGIVLFFLLGREVAGWRVGLFAAALGAVSKPILIGCINGASNVTAPMAVALLLLATFWVFKNPGWVQFIVWGAVLGFTPYNYTSVRTWLPFIVAVVLGWIWFYRQKEGKAAVDGPLGWGTLGAWTFLFLVIHKFLPQDKAWVAFLYHRWVGIAFIIGMSALCILSSREERPKSAPALIPRYYVGVLLAALIIYPLGSNPLIGVHPAGFSIFNNPNDLSVHVGLGTLKVFLAKIGDTLHTIFISGEDRGDMNITMDAFFDYHFILLLMLGVASFLTQPTWTKGFLMACGWVGISPHILSVDGHSGRLVCGLVPLAVLSGMGLEQMVQAGEKAFGKISKWVSGLLLAGLLSWAFQGTAYKVLKVFFEGDRVEKTISQQVKEFSPRARVFLSAYPLFVSGVTQCVLDQGYDFFNLQDQNPIYLKEGEDPKDVVVLMHIYDQKAHDKIQKQFEDVNWEMIYLGGWPDKRPACNRAIIPAKDIGFKPGALFYFVRVPASQWTRDFLVGRYILGYGMIEMEESVPTLYAPIPQAMLGRLVNLKGDFQITAGGKYQFKVRTNDYVKFVVDGKQVMYLAPDWTPLPASGSVELSPGVHKIEIDVYLQHEQTIPKVGVAGPDGIESVLDVNWPGTGGAPKI